MAHYCQGCRVEISGWPQSENHFVGSANDAGATIGHIFCASCWSEGVEDWFLNTNIDLAVWQLLECISGTADTATTNAHPFSEVVQYHTGHDTTLTDR